MRTVSSKVLVFKGYDSHIGQAQEALKQKSPDYNTALSHYRTVLVNAKGCNGTSPKEIQKHYNQACRGLIDMQGAIPYFDTWYKSGPYESSAYAEFDGVRVTQKQLAAFEARAILENSGVSYLEEDYKGPCEILSYFLDRLGEFTSDCVTPGVADMLGIDLGEEHPHQD